MFSNAGNQNRKEALEAWMKKKQAKPASSWGGAPTDRCPSPSLRKPMMPIQNGELRKQLNQTNFGSGKKSVERTNSVGSNQSPM